MLVIMCVVVIRSYLPRMYDMGITLTYYISGGL